MSTPRSATATDAETDATTDSPRRGVATVVFVVFLDLVGFGIVIPILPFYVRSFTPDETFIGLLAASYSLTQFVFAPYLGRLSDRYGRRPVILLSLLGAAVAWTVFGLGGALWVLFLSRMIAGAMGGNIAAAQAYVADVTPPEDRAGALGLVGASFALGFVFGPAIGGFFASEPVVAAAASVFPAFVPATSFSLPSFAAAGFSTIALVVGAVFLKEPERSRPAGGSAARRRSFVETLRWAIAGGGDDASERLRGLVLAFFVVSVAFAGVQVMFIPFVADVYGYDEAQAALLLTYIGVLGAINQGVLVGRLSRRFSSGPLATVGATLLLVALAALPFAPEIGRTLVPVSFGPAFGPEVIALLLVLALLSVGNGLLNVSLSTLVSQNAGTEAQGAAFGITQGAGSLGRTVGPPAMAFLYAVAGYQSPFLVGAVLLVGVVAITARMARG